MASCGKCGYQVRGISTLNCPECGADLREVGIVKGKSSNTVLWVMIVLGIVFAMFACCALSAFLLYVAEDKSQMSVPLSQPIPRPITVPSKLLEPPVVDDTDAKDPRPENGPGTTESPVEQ